MSFEKPTPPEIQAAIESGDKDHLRAAGRKGAAAANAKRSLEADIAEVQANRIEELRAKEELNRAIEANEHIISPDGEDHDHHPDNTNIH